MINTTIKFCLFFSIYNFDILLISGNKDRSQKTASQEGREGFFLNWTPTVTLTEYDFLLSTF